MLINPFQICVSRLSAEQVREQVRWSTWIRVKGNGVKPFFSMHLDALKSYRIAPLRPSPSPEIVKKSSASKPFMQIRVHTPNHLLKQTLKVQVTIHLSQSQNRLPNNLGQPYTLDSAKIIQVCQS